MCLAESNGASKIKKIRKRQKKVGPLQIRPYGMTRQWWGKGGSEREEEETFFCRMGRKKRSEFEVRREEAWYVVQQEMNFHFGSGSVLFFSSFSMPRPFLPLTPVPPSSPFFSEHENAAAYTCTSVYLVRFISPVVVDTGKNISQMRREKIVTFYGLLLLLLSSMRPACLVRFSKRKRGGKISSSRDHQIFSLFFLSLVFHPLFLRRMKPYTLFSRTRTTVISFPPFFRRIIPFRFCVIRCGKRRE